MSPNVGSSQEGAAYWQARGLEPFPQPEGQDSAAVNGSMHASAGGVLGSRSSRGSGGGSSSSAAVYGSAGRSSGLSGSSGTQHGGTAKERGAAGPRVQSTCRRLFFGGMGAA